MCARQRSNLSLASPRTSHQREGDPAVRVPFAALRGNLQCALQAGSAQTRLAAQTARGPGPLCAYAPRHGQRGWGAKQRFGPSLRAACASAPQAAQALGSDRDFAQRNSCSDPNPGTVGAARVLCHSCLSRRIQVPDNERLLSAMSRPEALAGAGRVERGSWRRITVLHRLAASNEGLQLTRGLPPPLALQRRPQVPPAYTYPTARTVQ